MKIERKYNGKKPWDDEHVQKIVSEETWKHLHSDPDFQDLRDKLNKIYDEACHMSLYGWSIHPDNKDTK